MTIKACIFDIDGTLTTERFFIPFNVRNTIADLQKGGMYCTVNTANAFVQYQYLYLNQVTPNSPLILENGGALSNLHEDYYYIWTLPTTILHTLQEYISLDKIELLACYMKYRGYKIYSDSGSISSNLKSRTSGEITSWRDMFKVLQQTDSPSQIILRLKDKNAVSSLLQIPSITVGKSDESTYELTPYNVHKGTGIKNWIELMSISLNEIAIFGDAENDIPAFDLPVGLKVAVGNSSNELMRKATHRVANVDELSKYLCTL